MDYNTVKAELDTIKDGPGYAVAWDTEEGWDYTTFFSDVAAEIRSADTDAAELWERTTTAGWQPRKAQI